MRRRLVVCSAHADRGARADVRDALVALEEEADLDVRIDERRISPAPTGAEAREWIEPAIRGSGAHPILLSPATLASTFIGGTGHLQAVESDGVHGSELVVVELEPVGEAATSHRAHARFTTAPLSSLDPEAWRREIGGPGDFPRPLLPRPR